jgi:hypothetical protein
MSETPPLVELDRRVYDSLMALAKIYRPYRVQSRLTDRRLTQVSKRHLVVLSGLSRRFPIKAQNLVVLRCRPIWTAGTVTARFI